VGLKCPKGGHEASNGNTPCPLTKSIINNGKPETYPGEGGMLHTECLKKKKFQTGGAREVAKTELSVKQT